MAETAPKAEKVTPPPPPAKAAKDRAAPKSGRPAGRPAGLEKRLIDLFLTIGMVVQPFNARDGMILAANAENMAKAWSNLAAENKAVKDALERLMNGGAWGQVVFSTGAVLFAIAQNHEVIPPNPLAHMMPGYGEDEEGPEPPPVPGMPTGAGPPPPAPSM